MPPVTAGHNVPDRPGKHAGARAVEPAGKWSRAYWADLAERVGTTALETLIPMWVTAEVVTGIDWEHALAVSASAAGLALLKGLLSNLKDSESGASLLDAPPGPVVTEEPAPAAGITERLRERGIG